MPTYEYRCPEGHEFELFQRMSDEPGASCPSCGKAAERLLSAGAGLLFKGEGFYITDYRSDDYRKAEKADRGNGAKETKKKETEKSDAPSKGESSSSSNKATTKSSGSSKDTGSSTSSD